MTGLELLNAMKNGDHPMPPMLETITMTMQRIESGEVLFAARADQRHVNTMGGVHGGFAATVLDSVTGCAVHTLLKQNESYGTIDLNVKMVRPVPLDVELIAVGKVINLSRRLGTSTGELKTADGKLLAYASCSCLINRVGA